MSSFGPNNQQFTGSGPIRPHMGPPGPPFVPGGAPRPSGPPRPLMNGNLGPPAPNMGPPLVSPIGPPAPRPNGPPSFGGPTVKPMTGPPAVGPPIPGANGLAPHSNGPPVRAPLVNGAMPPPISSQGPPPTNGAPGQPPMMAPGQPPMMAPGQPPLPRPQVNGFSHQPPQPQAPPPSAPPGHTPGPGLMPPSSSAIPPVPGPTNGSNSTFSRRYPTTMQPPPMSSAAAMPPQSGPLPPAHGPMPPQPSFPPSSMPPPVSGVPQGQPQVNNMPPMPPSSGNGSHPPNNYGMRQNNGMPPSSAHDLARGLGGLSVTQTGFQKMWGQESVDLLQNRHILPPDPIKPPMARLQAEQWSNINCSPDIFRATLTKIPETDALLKKARLPLGVLIHPFKDLSHLPVIQCTTIVRCRSCRTYINPFVHFVDQRRWRCNLCYRVNELPEEFLYDPVSKTYGDPSRRPECKSSTIEFIAPQVLSHILYPKTHVLFKLKQSNFYYRAS